MRWRTWVISASALVSGGCSDEHSCRLVGCIAVVKNLEVATVAPQDLTSTTADMCINSTCVPTAMPSPLGPLQTEFRGAFYGRVWLENALDGPEYRVVVEYTSGITNPTDGDVFRVLIKRADLSILISRSWVAAYTHEYPNGPDCDPRCNYATLTPAL